MAEKEPPNSTEGGQGTPGHELRPLVPFNPDVDTGPQRLKPSEPEPVPHRLDPTFPPHSDDIESAPPSGILQAPPPERSVRGIGFGEPLNRYGWESEEQYADRLRQRGIDSTTLKPFAPESFPEPPSNQIPPDNEPEK